MEFEYKSIQSFVDTEQTEHDRISQSDVQVKTNNLNDFIQKNVDALNESNYQGITNECAKYISGGAKINPLTNHNFLLTLTSFYIKFVKDCLNPSTFRPIGEEIFPLFNLIQEMSKSTDSACHNCIMNSTIKDILQIIIKECKEIHVLNPAIITTNRLLYCKPLTANLFDYGFLITKLYDLYDKYFFMKTDFSYFSDSKDSREILLLIIYPAFELIFVMLVSNPTKHDDLYFLSHQLTVTVCNVLKGNRSIMMGMREKDPEIHKSQCKMMLTQLKYLLQNSPKKIVDRYTTIDIVSAVIDRILMSDEEISFLALCCIEQYSKTFPGAFFIFRAEAFYNFRPEVQYIRLVKQYAICWTRIIKTILTMDTPSYGRAAKAAEILENCAPDIINYFIGIVKNTADADFDFQKTMNFTFFILGNFKNQTSMQCILKSVPDIIEKVSFALEEQDPEDSLILATTVFNICKYVINTKLDGQVHDQLIEYYNDIHQNLSAVLNSLNPSIKEELDIGNKLNSLIKGIDASFEQIK